MRLRPTAKKFIDELEEVGKRLINSSRETRHTQKEQAEPSPEVRAIIAAPDGIYTKKHATDAKQDRQYRIWNLLLQGLLCLLTAGAFCAAAYYACYAKKQWETMNQTVREMQRQTSVAQIDQRPWVGLARIEQEKQPGMTHKTIALRLIFKNYGKTPPTGLIVDARLVDAATNKGQGVFDEMDLRCQRGKIYADTNPRFRSWTILPGSEIITSDFHNLWPDDPPNKDFSKIDISTLRGMQKPHIAGCIRYTTQFDSCLHQTKFYSPLLALKSSSEGALVFDVYATDVDKTCDQKQ